MADFDKAFKARRYMVQHPTAILYDSQFKRWQWDNCSTMWLCTSPYGEDFQVAKWQPEEWNAPFYHKSLGERLASESIKAIDEMVKKSFAELEDKTP